MQNVTATVNRSASSRYSEGLGSRSKTEIEINNPKSHNQNEMKFVLLCILLAAIVAMRSDASPTAASCNSAYTAMGGFNSLSSTLIPCASFKPGSQPSEACCSAALQMLGNGGSALAGCLCIQSVFSDLLTQISQSSLAQSAGITASSVTEIMTKCSVPFYGSPNCK